MRRHHVLGPSAIAGSILALGIAFGARVAAQSFQIPAGCGSELEFRRQLAELVGEQVGAALPVELRIEGPDARGVHLLRVRFGAEQRQLEDVDCPTLLRSAAVIVAAQSKPSPSAPTPTPAPSSPVSPVVAPPAATTAAPVASATGSRPRTAVGPSAPAAPRRSAEPDALAKPASRTRPSPASYALAVGAGVTDGVVPGAGLALELRASREPRPLGWAVAARYWPRETGSRQGRQVEVSATGGRAAGLIRLAPEVQLAAGLEVNRLSGTGSGTVSGRAADSAWQVAPTLELAAIPWNVGSLRLEVGVSGRLSVVRPRFVITGFGDVYEVPTLGADAIIRAVWLFQ